MGKKELKIQLDKDLREIYYKEYGDLCEGRIGAFYRLAVSELAKIGIVKTIHDVKKEIIQQLRTEFIIEFAKLKKGPVDPYEIFEALKRKPYGCRSRIEVMMVLEKHGIETVKPKQSSDINSNTLDLVDGEMVRLLLKKFGVKVNTLKMILLGIIREGDPKLSIEDVYRRIWELGFTKKASFGKMGTQLGISQTVAKRVYEVVDMTLSPEEKKQIENERQQQPRNSSLIDNLLKELEKRMPTKGTNGKSEQKKQVPEEIIVFLKEKGLTNSEISVFFDSLGINVSEALIGRRYRDVGKESREESKKLQEEVDRIIPAFGEKLSLTEAENNYSTAVNQWKEAAKIEDNDDTNRGEKSLEELNRRLEELRKQKEITAKLLASYLIFFEKLKELLR